MYYVNLLNGKSAWEVQEAKVRLDTRVVLKVLVLWLYTDDQSR